MRELIQRLSNSSQVSKESNLLGRALLKKDGLTGKKYWVSWGEDGREEVIFSAGQPLVFPPEGMQEGVEIKLCRPKK